MEWNLDTDRPIYSQLIEQITLAIFSGEYAPGDKLPAVREMAMEAAVNPNTMQKALSELERDGLVYTKRTSGRFITDDKEMLFKVKTELAKSKIESFFAQMQSMGFTSEEILALMESAAKNL